MGDERVKSNEQKQEGAEKGFLATVAGKAIEPVAAGVATAGAAYVTRKSAEIWRKTIAPKIHEQGGPRATAEGAFRTVSATVREQASAVRSALGEKVGDIRERGGDGRLAAFQQKPPARRDEERSERQRRRTERERALKRLGSS
ncbi:MAG TPA: hypothetical protein VE693_12325 [Gaiellaceae bacterium]|nr:hypothetical protein [Gaiellaceae bacterium]